MQLKQALCPQDRLLQGVDRDLEPFQHRGITLQMVEQVYCTFNLQSFRVQVSSKAGMKASQGHMFGLDRKILAWSHWGPSVAFVSAGKHTCNTLLS